MGMGGGGVNYCIVIKLTYIFYGSGSTVDQGMFRNATYQVMLVRRRCHLMNKIFHQTHLKNVNTDYDWVTALLTH